MTINSDYVEILQCFVEETVRFLVVGGYAVIKYSEPYTTKDLALWIARNRENAEYTYRALARFGAPLGDLSVDDLLNPDLVYQLGIEPVRVDVMCFVSGLDFDAAWKRRDRMMYGGLEAPVLCIEDASSSKKASGRPKDLIQASELDRIIRQRRQP
ncbi:MAG: hypothetical protein ABI806_23120 [Candidatus Solibacter sp.]